MLQVISPKEIDLRRVATPEARPNFCASCPIGHCTRGYLPAVSRPGTSLIVSEAPDSDEVRQGAHFANGAGGWLKNMLRLAGIKWEGVSTLSVLGCSPKDTFPADPKFWSMAETSGAVAHCRKHHFEPALRRAQREGRAAKIYALGGEALRALTGRFGLHSWRGSVLPLFGEKKANVIPTLTPQQLMRQSKLTSVVVHDLRRPLTLPPENYNLFPSLADVQRFRAKSFAFDFEWDASGNITLCGLSDRFYGAVVVPWQEPYISELRRIFEAAEHLIGHNIVGADLPFIERLGWSISAQIEDTMLKQHLVQPDYPHDLAFVASVFTSKVFWKGKWEEVEEEGEGDFRGQQWRTWDRADALPRRLGGYGGCLSGKEAFALYNARDTDAEFQINTPLDQLLGKWELDRAYRHVSLPAGYICRWMSERGLKVDTSRLGEIRQGVDASIAELEVKLPEGLRPYEDTVSCNLPAPPGTYRPKTKKCKGAKKLGTSHPSVDIVFNTPGDLHCPVCGAAHSSGTLTEAKIIKGTRQELIVPYNSAPRVMSYVESLQLAEVIDRKTGRRTTGKKARALWAKDHPEFVLLGELKEKVTLRNNFAKDTLLNLDRMYFNLKVHGTAEGRLSCSGRRRGIDLNIQNQPEAFRAIYVPEREDWGFVNIDISQGESWLTCWIAKDWERWEKLQDPNYDEHSEIAQAIFNTPVSKALAKKDEAVNALRQLGKKINHGRAYGMGARTQLENLQSQGYDHFTQRDVTDFIETWKKLNRRTAEWQQETMEMATRQGYLRNPFGRVRWFSHKDGTQALAFLPASTLADIILRCMIAHYPEKFYEAIQANGMDVFHELVPEWIMSIMVHDSLVLQGPWESRQEQIDRSSAILCQPWKELDGFAFRVDVKASQKSWGDC